MPGETIRVITTSEARSHALVAALDGVGGAAFSENGLHEVHVRPDAATASSLMHLFDAVGEWLGDGNEASCEMHFGDRVLTVVAPSNGTPGDATKFLLERTIQLQTALESRVAIEQAKGMLAERLGVSLDEAFAFLRSAARAQGIKLAVLAAEVVESPEMPPELARSSITGALSSRRV
jgi:hypothetical protein